MNDSQKAALKDLQRALAYLSREVDEVADEMKTGVYGTTEGLRIGTLTLAIENLAMKAGRLAVDMEEARETANA